MVQAVSHRDNFIWLLGGLVFLLFSGAMLEQHGVAGGQRLINISIGVTLLVAVWALEQQRDSWLRSRIGVSLIVAALMVGDAIFEDYRLTLVQLSFVFAFLCLSTYLACRQVLFSGNVDGNKIIGAICIYIMMALLWAFGYLLIEELYPDSFTGLPNADWHDNLQEVFYFSFVTLTTLGYGDISPAQPLARFWGYMEAVTGQFYIAILVASLIGTRLSKEAQEDANKPKLQRRAEDVQSSA
jgi:voltage-gated potassium channel